MTPITMRGCCGRRKNAGVFYGNGYETRQMVSTNTGLPLRLTGPFHRSISRRYSVREADRLAGALADAIAEVVTDTQRPAASICDSVTTLPRTGSLTHWSEVVSDPNRQPVTNTCVEFTLALYIPV